MGGLNAGTPYLGALSDGRTGAESVWLRGHRNPKP